MKMFKKRGSFEHQPNRNERKQLLKEKREKLDYGFYNDERLPQGHSWVKQGWGTQYECELCREKTPDSSQIWAGVCYGRRMDEALM